MKRRPSGRSGMWGINYKQERSRGSRKNMYPQNRYRAKDERGLPKSKRQKAV